MRLVRNSIMKFALVLVLMLLGFGLSFRLVAGSEMWEFRSVNSYGLYSYGSEMWEFGSVNSYGLYSYGSEMWEFRSVRHTCLYTYLYICLYICRYTRPLHRSVCMSLYMYVHMCVCMSIHMLLQYTCPVHVSYIHVHVPYTCSCRMSRPTWSMPHVLFVACRLWPCLQHIFVLIRTDVYCDN